MAQTLSLAAQNVLRAGGLAEPRAELWDGTTLTATLALTGGEVTFERAAPIPRSARVELAGFDALIPEAGTLTYSAVYGEVDGTYGGGTPATYAENVNRQLRGLIRPGRTELRLAWRFHLDDGTVEDVPLGRYRVSTVAFTHTPDGVTAEVSGFDVARLVAKAGYVTPLLVARDANVRDALAAVFTRTVPGVTLVAPTTTHTAPRLAFLPVDGANPWRDAQRIAYGAAWELSTSRDGSIVAAAAQDPGTGTAVWNVTEATLVTAATAWDDEHAVNTVVVWGQTPEDVPIRGFAELTTGEWSVARIGRRTRYETLPVVRTQAQADSAAQALLRRYIGAQDQVEVETPPLPQLDPGDLVDVTDNVLNLEDTTYLVERVTLNVDPTRPTRLVLSRRLA